MLYIKCHKSKSYFLQISLALFLGTTASMHSMSDKAVISTYQGVNGPWQLLEFIFTTNVHNQVEHFQKHSFAALGIAGTTFLAKSFLYDQASKPVATEKAAKNPIKSIVTIFSALAAGKTCYDYLTCSVKRNIQHKTLLNVLQKWELYRPNFPTSLVEYFDELEAQYNSKFNFVTDAVVSEVFELITHHIEHHFESRYKKSEPKSLTTMESFKNCADIWKNLE